MKENAYMDGVSMSQKKQTTKVKYNPSKYEKLRNMDIEVANEALLRRMVSIVNVSYYTLVANPHSLYRGRTST